MGILFAAAILVLPAATAQAQTAAFDAQYFKPPPAGDTGIGTRGAEFYAPGTWGIGFGWDGTWRPLSLELESQGLPRRAIVDRRTDFRLSLHHTPFTGFTLGVMVPAVLEQGGLDTDFSRRTLGADRLRDPIVGDIAATARLLLLHQRGAVPAIALYGMVLAPTGNEEAFAGEAGVTGDARLVLSERIGDGSLDLEGGLRVRTEDAVVGDDTIGNQILFGAAASIPTGLVRRDYGRWFVIGAQGTWGGNEAARTLEPRVAIRTRWIGPGHAWTLSVGAGGAILRSPGSPYARFFISVERISTDPWRDSDADGIADVRDGCPAREEDPDGFEDSDGCPEEDNDGDLILDDEDECPNEPEDRDGILDEDGCPDPDVPDADKDGFPDAEDKCPNEPEDLDYFEDLDGCPEPDNDGDGFADINDLCPNSAENKNGIEDDDGCPDGGKLVVVRRNKIRLLREIRFKSGTVEPTKKSVEVIKQLAEILKNKKRLRVSLELVPTHKHKKGQKFAERRLDRLQRALTHWGARVFQVRTRVGKFTRKNAGKLTIRLR